MDYAIETSVASHDLIDLFQSVFSASEGADEGALIGGLVATILSTTDSDDLVVATARDGGILAGCILLTRMRYDADPRSVFLLSPVAIRTDLQGQGVGQALIRHGLRVLRDRGVEIVVTYGDPAFYGKVGFRPVTTDQVPSPHTLQMPQGWIAQSLTGDGFAPLQGPAHCVPAFDNPAIW